MHPAGRGVPRVPTSLAVVPPFRLRIFLWAVRRVALNPPVPLRKVTLVGVGLLGGSLGLALKARGLAVEVHGYVRRAEVAPAAESAGVVDRATANLGAAVAGADLVVLCTPIGQMGPLAAACVPHLKRGALITDVGSVKGPVVAELEPLAEAAGAWFVGSHPMAGSERTGFEAARADLFEGAVCVVTPTERTHGPAREQIESLWTAVGGEVMALSPGQHDELVSRSSHLPHVVAAGLANYVLSPAHAAVQARLCAAGFRDTTRIAGGPPEMWRDIALANRAHLARALGVLVADLGEFQQALEEQDAAAVEEFFRKARERRESWLAGGRPVPSSAPAAASSPLSPRAPS